MLKLFHGSNVVIDKIDLCRSRKGKVFGCGFYLNPNESQARLISSLISSRGVSWSPASAAVCLIP